MDKLPSKDKNIATKRDRLRKWSKMIRYGLDVKPAEMVIDKALEVKNGNTVGQEEMMPL